MTGTILSKQLRIAERTFRLFHQRKQNLCSVAEACVEGFDRVAEREKFVKILRSSIIHEDGESV